MFGFGYAIFSKLYIVVVVYVCYVRKLTASAFKICLRHTHTHTDTDKLRFIAINDLGCFVVWFPRHQSSAYALINFVWNFVLLFWGFSRFLFIYLLTVVAYWFWNLTTGAYSSWGSISTIAMHERRFVYRGRPEEAWNFWSKQARREKGKKKKKTII